MVNRAFVWMVMGLFLLSGLAFAGYDPSGQIDAQDLSEESVNALGLENSMGNAALSGLAPQTAATGPGDAPAAYIDQIPPQDRLGMLMPIDVEECSLWQIYYSGDYLAWGSFRSIFPSDLPGLWIAGADGWSLYATMPLGSLAQEMLYVPRASSVSMYEVYPGGSVRRYNLGYFQPGFYYIWYYADSPGRHFSQFAIGDTYSNTVIIDVYSRLLRPNLILKKQYSPSPLYKWVNDRCFYYPKPAPNPVAECEAKGCQWYNGKCHCDIPKPVPNPVAECEAKGCQWYNGKCHCDIPKPVPNPVAECEALGCQWYDGECHCDVPKPVPNPVAECEMNPTCHWVDGQCLCTGYDPDGPVPGPVPNPTPDPLPEPEPVPYPDPIPDPMPEPEPAPGPVPNPVAECEATGCHWADGQCLCT